MTLSLRLGYTPGMVLLPVFKELGRLAVSEDRPDPSQAPDSHAAMVPTAGPRPVSLPGGGHAFFAHIPLWDYCDPALARPYAAGVEGREVFLTLPAGAGVAEVARHTRLFVFLGAEKSPELEAALAVPGAMCLLFEPDPGRLDAFLSANKAWALAKANLFFIGGDPERLDPPLLFFLPEEICKIGWPACFAPAALSQAGRTELCDAEDAGDEPLAYCLRVARLAEVFYYRGVIYLLDSQEHVRGMPLRPMRKDAIYDRVLHFYRNLLPCLQGGTITDLQDLFPGRTAVLAAAGPALSASLPFIRKNRDRCVLIAVNNALKSLLAEGIVPHFTVINDTSLASGQAFAGLAPLPTGALVAHCLSESAPGVFPRSFFFGNFPGQPFPKREGLLLHGSVITTAFSLAELLGCTRAVLAGVQLASPDPWRMSYSKGSQYGSDTAAPADPLTGRWPQLCPVRAVGGGRMYTNLNFLDSALWFRDRISAAKLEVVNLCPESILSGPGVALDENPPMPEPFDADALLAGLPARGFPDAKARTLDLIRQNLGVWKQKQREARAAAADPASIPAFVAKCDGDNSAFMVQRYEDFDNRRFHRLFFEAASEPQRLEGGRYFCDYMARMASALLGELTRQHMLVSAQPGG